MYMIIHGVGMHGWVQVGAWAGEDLGDGIHGWDLDGDGMLDGLGVDGMIHFGGQAGAGDGIVGMAQAGAGTLVGAGMQAGAGMVAGITT